MAIPLPILNGPIRPGAEIVHVYSEGTLAYLYDAGSENQIRELEPSVIHGYENDSAEDDATQEAVEEGLLLLYAMEDDGDIDAEVLIGQPLSAAETTGGDWYPYQQGYLQLPTGRLYVHSISTLPMGANEGEELEEQGAVIETTAGEYVVTVYRKKWATMRKQVAEDDWDEDTLRTNEIIVLTPEDELEVDGDRPTILFDD